jgi:hypothetical protein
LSTLSELARGEPCQIRLPGICNHNVETTVLCHVRLIGVSAMSLKAPDILAAWGCSACHEACDRGPPADADTETLLVYERRRAALLEGMARTQYQLMRRGLLSC